MGGGREKGKATEEVGSRTEQAELRIEVKKEEEKANRERSGLE
jgi:hypothetical protein